MSSRRLPGFTELKVLGRGDKGRVVLARCENTRENVTIRYFFPSSLPEDRHHLRQKAQTFSTAWSPHVARLHEMVDDDGGMAMIMEALDGLALQEVLRKQGSLEPLAALTVLKGSLLGLGAAHRTGIVHGDFGPSEIVVTSDGVSKVIGFGAVAPNGTETLAVTPAHTAADAYAATAVFFECITGHRPFTGSSSRESVVRRLQAPVLLEEVPEPLRPLVSLGMAEDPADRPADAASFLTELERIATRIYGGDWERRGRELLAAGTGASGTGFTALSGVLKHTRLLQPVKALFRPVVLFTLVMLALLATLVVLSPARNGPASQVRLALPQDRLFDGTVVVRGPDRAQAEKDIVISAFVCGPSITGEGCPPEAVEALDPGAPSSSTRRTLKAGGRIRAELRPASGTVKVSAIGRAVQPVRLKGDWASWVWSVNSGGSGTFPLVLGLTVLKGDTDEPQVATRYYPVTLTVTKAPTDWWATLGRSFNAVTGWLVTVITALGALGLGTFLFQTRQERRARTTSETPSGPGPGPSPVADAEAAGNG